MLKLRLVVWLLIVVALTATGSGFSIVAAVETPPAEDVQVLTSGPIHEAFAEAVALDPEPGIVAPKEPPALIEEISPDQKPEGDVQWIPGYWAWDDERAEYIWVSGIWRVLPPERQWVPGYWNSVTDGYQWVSGYWTSVKDQVTEYLPEPPESVEIGPSSNAPSPDYIWIPGCWLWHDGRYLWRPGYWGPAHRDWVWVPARYNWTPRGYIFVSGYWDFTVIHRGILFAPVFFPRIHLGLTFPFSPSFVISLNIFDDVLFLRPRYHHYYFGDYFAPGHYRRGIYPWFSLHARRVVYDPIYTHQRWNHRTDHEWENRLETRFRERREYEGSRPPRSFDHRKGPDKAGRLSKTVWADSVKPVDHAEKNKAGTYRFHPLSEKERKEFTQREKEVRTYQKNRQIRETQKQNMPAQKAQKKPEPNREKFSKSPAMDKTDPKKERKVQETRVQNKPVEKVSVKPVSNKEKFSKSPIIDKPNQKVDRKKPPALFQTPKPNPNVEPLQRGNGSPRSWKKSQESGDNVQKSGNSGQRSMDNGQQSEGRGGLWKDRMQKSNDGPRKQNNGR